MMPFHELNLYHSNNHKFRYHSRQVLSLPGNLPLHKLRIEVAKNFSLNEPLQGALADMFYGCWFEMPYQGAHILDELESRLLPRIYNAFQELIQRQQYMLHQSELATRWSVLVTPSLNVATHHLRISSDDARRIANQVVIELINIKKAGDTEQLKKAEAEFFAHCIGCFDRIGFSIAWFKLAKQDWDFDESWYRCQHHLETRET